MAPMQSHLERFPEGAIEVAQGRILDFNRAAQAQFPELAVGMEAPEFLSGSLSDPEGAGTFAHNGSLYLFSRVSGTERDLLLFRPAPQSPLTQGQLDGFVRQMRGFLQDILLEFETVSGPSRGGMDAFSKSFCRVYRLLSNLDFLRSAGAPEGVCRSLTQEAAFLLGEAGVTLTFRCTLPSLLIPGDPGLLQKLILTLLSNAAKAAPGGQVVLSLSSRSGRAVLTLSDSGDSSPSATAATPWRTAVWTPCSPPASRRGRSPIPRTGRAWAWPSPGTSSPSTGARCSWRSGGAGCSPWSPCPPAPCRPASPCARPGWRRTAASLPC